MPRYAKKSDLSKKDVMQKAFDYFGPGGLGLDLTERGPCCIRFQGGGGHVSMEVTESAESSGIEAEIETREWDYHVKEFLKEI